MWVIKERQQTLHKVMIKHLLDTAHEWEREEKNHIYSTWIYTSLWKTNYSPQIQVICMKVCCALYIASDHVQVYMYMWMCSVYK